MKLLAALIAALALTGAANASTGIPAADALIARNAPAATVSCDPGLDNRNAGETVIPTGQVSLASYVCVGLLLWQADAAWRPAFLAANPQIRTVADSLIGVGVLVALHESFHAAGNPDETAVECAALAAAPAYLTAEQLRYAHAYDATLSAAYHAHPC